MPTASDLTYLLHFADQDIPEALALTQGGFLACSQRPGLLSLVICTDGNPFAEVVLRDGMRPYWGRLHRVLLDVASGRQYNRVYAVVFGWEIYIEGETIQALTWVTHDGRVLMGNTDLDGLEQQDGQ